MLPAETDIVWFFMLSLETNLWNNLFFVMIYMDSVTEKKENGKLSLFALR